MKNWTVKIANIVSEPDWISLKHLVAKFSQKTFTCIEYPYSPETFTSWGEPCNEHLTNPKGSLMSG